MTDLPAAQPVRGVVAYGAYVPYYRLTAASRAQVLQRGGGKISRAVASYDEDPVTMGVEAAQAALRTLASEPGIGRLYFATTSAPYVDKTNATLLHAALRLPRTALAVDMGGAPRSGLGALLAAHDAPERTLVALSELRVGLPGGSEEIGSGDAAAAFVFDKDSESAPVLASLLASAWATDEFLDRWRAPGEAASHVWEERFGEHAYLSLATDSFEAALKQAGLLASDVDRLIVCGLASRPVKVFAARSGVARERIADDRVEVVGNTGLAQPGVLLADALDQAAPGETIAVVHLADGASTLVLRTTEALVPARRPRRSVATQIASTNPGLAYSKYLSWRGLLVEEPPRRPEPDAPAAPPTMRSSHFKYGFVGGRCPSCGTVSLPPSRVCFHCGDIADPIEQPMADAPATVATFTVDRLAFTPSPPMIAVVLDFEGGGRFRCEATDADASAVGIGDPMELTFRKLFTRNGVHNYFWKARPIRNVTSVDGDLNT